MDILKRIFEAVLDYLEPRLKRAFTTLVKNRPFAFGLAALLFVLSCAAGYYSFKRADFYVRVVERALLKRTENTPQTYKAIEALVLSNTETEEDGSEFSYRQELMQARFSRNFADSLEELDQVLANEQTTAGQVQFELITPDLDPNQLKRPQDAIITEKNNLGFLFLPAKLLQLDEASFSDMLAKSSTSVIAAKIGVSEDDAHNQTCSEKVSPVSICDDVLFSRRALEVMKHLTKVRVTDSKLHEGIDLQPIQVYYITENGLNRIVSRNGNERAGNDLEFYRSQFRASTVFQARPYYLGAFGELTSPPRPLVAKGQQIQGYLDYFYISEPYLDIGGNGVVITLARAFKYGKHSEGAICLDLRVEALGKKFEQLVAALKGHYADITCTVPSTGATTCKGGSDQELVDVPDKIRMLLDNAGQEGTLSDVLGEIAFLDKEPNVQALRTAQADTSPTLFAKLLHTSKPLRFAVPLEPPLRNRGISGLSTMDIKLKAVSLNVGQYLQNTALIGALGVVLLGLALGVVMVAWAGDARHRADLQRQSAFLITIHATLREALDNVSQVMLNSTTPYARLDSEDRIVAANAKLAEFLGYPASDEGVKRLRGTKFQEWIGTDESRAQYRKVEESRRKRETVPNYWLDFRSIDGSLKRADVFSSVVPASQANAEALPETFGILVPQNANVITSPQSVGFWME